MRDAPRDHLLDVELRHAEGRQRPEDLARDRRIVGRLRRLQLVRRDDDVIDQHAGHAHVMRLQRAVLDDALDLRDDDAAIVARRQRLLEPAEIGALVLVGEVAALVRRGGADDRDLRRDGSEIEPVLAVELLDLRTIGSLAARSWRSPRGAGRRKCRARPWSARPAAWPPPRDACRTGCRRGCCRRRSRCRRSSARSAAARTHDGPDG